MHVNAEQFAKSIKKAQKADNQDEINRLIRDSTIYGVDASTLFKANDPELRQKAYLFSANPTEFVSTYAPEALQDKLLQTILKSSEAQNTLDMGLQFCIEEKKISILKTLIKHCEQDNILYYISKANEISPEALALLLENLTFTGLKLSDHINSNDDFSNVKQQIKDIENDPISFAFKNLKGKALELFIKNHINYRNQYNESILMIAIKNDLIEDIEPLLKYGLKINDTNNYGENALMLAAKNGNTALLKQCISNGGDVNQINTNGQNALMISAQQPGSCIRLLIDNGIQLDFVDPKGRNALIHATMAGNAEMIALLTENGCDIKAKDNEGSSPLHTAIIRNAPVNVIEKIIEKGGEVNVDSLSNGQIRYFAYILEQSELPESVKSRYYDSMKIYNMPISWLRTEGISSPNFLKNIDKFMLAPTKTVSDIAVKSKSYKGPINALTIESIEILEADKKVKDLIANDPESAMRDDEVIKAKKHFEEQVKPYFKDQFNSYPGNNDLEKIENIEKEIRAKLFDQMLDVAKLDKNNNLIRFLEANKEKLINLAPGIAGEKDVYLSSRDNAVFAAWRCYDPDFKTIEWPNLLIPPKSKALHSETVFTTDIMGSSNEKEASYYVRQMAAYTYLSCMDIIPPSPETPHPPTTDDRWGVFLIQLENIRHAHNEGSYTKLDNPSCFPGCVSRLGNAAMLNSRLKPIPTPREEAIRIFKEDMNKLYMDYLANIARRKDLTLKEKHALMYEVHYSVLLLGKNNAAANVTGNDYNYDIDYLPERTKFKNAVKASLGEFPKIVRKLNAQTMATTGGVLSKQDEAFLRQYYIDISLEQNTNFNNCLNSVTNSMKLTHKDQLTKHIKDTLCGTFNNKTPIIISNRENLLATLERYEPSIKNNPPNNEELSTKVAERMAKYILLNTNLMNDINELSAGTLTGIDSTVIETGPFSDLLKDPEFCAKLDDAIHKPDSFTLKPVDPEPTFEENARKIVTSFFALFTDESKKSRSEVDQKAIPEKNQGFRNKR